MRRRMQPGDCHCAIVTLVLCWFTASSWGLNNNSLPALPKWEFDNELLNWEAPLEYQKRFPYYIAGYDYEKRPVVIVEFGKWDIRSVVERGERDIQILKNYTTQFVNRMLLLKSPFPDADDGSVAIFDAEGYSLRQLRHLPTSKFLVDQALYLNLVEPYAHKVIVVNSNFVIESLISMVRSVGGKFFDKVETYGPNPSRYIPALLEIIPRDQLPPWYGGIENFKPVQIYG